jgi:hypothetical protein
VCDLLYDLECNNRMDSSKVFVYLFDNFYAVTQRASALHKFYGRTKHFHSFLLSNLKVAHERNNVVSMSVFGGEFAFR